MFKTSKIQLLFALFVLFYSATFAQKKELTIDAAYVNRAVYPASLRNLQWVKNTNTFSYTDGDKIKIESVSGKDNSEISIDVLNAALKEMGISSLKRWPMINWTSQNTLQFSMKDSIYELDVKAKKIKFINIYPSQSEYIQQEPNNNKVAFTKGANLFMNIGGNEIEVTNDTENGIVNGQTVSRSEFGITHGIFWSPKGNLLAYYKKDESKVTEYPLVDIDPAIAVVKNTRYPMAGTTSEKVEVYVYNPTTKKTVVLQTGPAVEQYQTNISWSPDEKYIYIAELNRAQNHMKLKKYDATNGNLIKVLFEEKNEKYVEPENGLYFLNGRSDQFVWLSERDGFNHAYLYDTEGNMLKQLTSGNWMITDFIGFNADNSACYFISTKESPIERHLYSLDMKKNVLTKLTLQRGTHNPILNDNMSYFLDMYSNYNEIAREYTLCDTKGKLVRIVKKNENPLKDYNMGEMSISTLKSDNGVDLYYRIIKPTNFDPSKKYPVIVYVYGGPHAQMISDSWLGGSGMWLQFLASQGFIVFTLDNQGSANRGFAFESIIHRQVGTQEMQDQMKGVQFLKNLPYVDASRIGVDGWSYGGFMTINLKLSFPETFKVAVAGGPVIDWKYYEVMYGERYMDTPEENADGYTQNNLINKVSNHDGKLLIIHGTVDPTVVWQNSLKFIQECVNKQKQVDYFVYPGHEHNVGGMDRLHLETKIYEYFKANL